MTADTTEAWCPRRAPSVLLRHDRTRGKDVLLMPERVVVLEGSARSVLELCDGTRTVAGIAVELSRRFPGPSVESDVRTFVARVRKEGWIR